VIGAERVDELAEQVRAPVGLVVTSWRRSIELM